MAAAGTRPDLDDPSGLQVFEALRGRIFGIAYRVLGSASDAEDVVQEVWIRWQRSDRSAIRDPAAFLATAATRFAINVAQSAHHRRETYVGPWLPEPVDTEADPTLGAENGEALGFAAMLLLERLTPTERAAYVLRVAFDFPYSRIAEIVQLTEAAARQLVSRARRHLEVERRRPVGYGEHERLLAAFLRAAQDGDVQGLEQLLAADVVSYSDGGGAVRASRIPVRGRAVVAKFIRAFAPRFWVGVTVEIRQVNGQPCAVIDMDGVTVATVALVLGADGIETVLWTMNPAKLARVRA